MSDRRVVHSGRIKWYGSNFYFCRDLKKVLQERMKFLECLGKPDTPELQEKCPVKSG